MLPGDTSIGDRITLLERRLRRTQLAALAGLLGSLVLGLAAWRQQPASQDVVRARALIIQDAAGRPRIVLGAPVPDPKGGARRSAATGMVINDSAGYERFGVGLSEDDMIAMGFDAPRTAAGSGGGERLTLSVGRMGNGTIRFLDRASLVRAHMTLFNDNTVGLFFTDYENGKTIVHRISAKGDTVVVHER